jgi:hypothetical protein
MVVIQQWRPTPKERGDWNLSCGSEACPGMRCGRSQSIKNFSSCQGKSLSHQENWHNAQVPPCGRAATPPPRGRDLC